LSPFRLANLFVFRTPFGHQSSASRSPPKKSLVIELFFNRILHFTLGLYFLFMPTSIIAARTLAPGSSKPLPLIFFRHAPKSSRPFPDTKGGTLASVFYPTCRNGPPSNRREVFCRCQVEAGRALPPRPRCPSALRAVSLSSRYSPKPPLSPPSFLPAESRGACPCTPTTQAACDSLLS